MADTLLLEPEESHHALTVLLVPAKTDQQWWHEVAVNHEVRFIRGRVAFGGAATAPMPVCVIIVSATHGPRMTTLSQPQTSIFDTTEEG